MNHECEENLNEQQHKSTETVTAKRRLGRHPKFPSFLKALSQGAVAEGTVLEFTVTTPDGRVLNSNLKITAEDMALVEQLKDMAK